MVNPDMLNLSRVYRFRLLVIYELIETYEYNIATATQLFDQSHLSRRLLDDPMMVYHYDAAYWARDIRNTIISN